MSTSPDLGLPYIASSQSQPEVTHNEALNLIAALLNGVVDRGTNTPPGSPAAGDAYVVGTSPTGAWAGRANCVTIYSGTAWDFVPGEDSNGTPITMGVRQEGMRVYVRDEDTMYVWDGAAWAAQWLDGSSTVDPGSLLTLTTETHSITVTGAAMGDFAVPSFSLSITGLVMTAYVSAADTVTVVLFNPTAGTINIASGTMRARVYKRLS